MEIIYGKPYGHFDVTIEDTEIWVETAQYEIAKIDSMHVFGTFGQIFILNLDKDNNQILDVYGEYLSEFDAGIYNQHRESYEVKVEGGYYIVETDHNYVGRIRFDSFSEMWDELLDIAKGILEDQ